MNVFNRLLLIVALASLAAFAIGIIFFTWAMTHDSVNALSNAVDWLDDNQTGSLEKTLVSTGSALVALVALTLLYIELMPRSGPEVRVTDLKVGNAMLSTESIGQRIEEVVRQVGHVSDVRATVRPKRKGVTVDLDLHVDPEANLAAVTDEACEAARDVLANRVHVALVVPPKARLHYRELRLNRPAARRPLLTAPSIPGADGTASLLPNVDETSLPDDPSGAGADVTPEEPDSPGEQARPAPSREQGRRAGAHDDDSE